MQVVELPNKGGGVCGKMRCAAVLLALLLSLSALSASTAEAHEVSKYSFAGTFSSYGSRRIWCSVSVLIVVNGNLLLAVNF